MKPKNMIVWILLLGILVLLMSTSVQAKELTEVNANNILEKIENGEDVYLENARIIGDFDVDKIELKNVSVIGFKLRACPVIGYFAKLGAYFWL